MDRGLIGLYKGNQAETVYNRVDGGNLEGDIHAVKTTSASPSVSIHVLGNDTGCVWRHQFIPEAHSVKSFRSGYANAPCKEEDIKNVSI